MLLWLELYFLYNLAAKTVLLFMSLEDGYDDSFIYD